MEIEQTNGQKVNFGLVVGLACVALIIIAIASVILVSWRSHQKNKAPFTKHPVSMLQMPVSTGQDVAAA